MVTWVRGGTDPDAVGALYARLNELLAGSATPDAGPMLLAQTVEEFGSSRSRITQPLDDVDVVIRTSGSTDGLGHLVGLSLGALTASARATLARLGGPGQWVTSLPVHAVAGLQVVLRSALAGIAPVVYASPGGFDAPAFAACVARLAPGERHYLSLVPTQLHRAMDRAPELLAGFDAILVGGAALAPGLATRALDAGVRVVASYGSTETSGGCVYDGVPLDGVEVRLREGRIEIGGLTLATRYLDTEAQPFVVDHGRRWLATHDLGEWVEGRLVVRGRADDVIISGGVNVNPLDVEAALAALAGQWVVVGVPDAEWGERVVALGTGPATLADVRSATGHLGPAGRPVAVVRVESLPVRHTGKVDRRAAAALARRTLQT